jgi:aminopeptidase N
MRSAILIALIFVPTARAQVTHYTVKLTPDLDHHVLRGEETIEFQHDAGNIEWQKQSGLQIIATKTHDGEPALADETVSIRLRRSGKHVVRFEYTAAYTAARSPGMTWFTKDPGFDADFYCQVWMVCDSSPAQRATLTLEIVLPAASELKAVGPGRLKKEWQNKEGEHAVFEQSAPVQTYLFSFGVAKLNRSLDGQFVLYSADTDAHKVAFTKTADAYAFLRGTAGVDLADSQYTQASMPEPIGQEAGGLALMPPNFLPNLEQKDNVQIMSHELAHQWWGVLVGIRSWSDFWLNEGMADFMSYAYVEHHQGRAAYYQQISNAKKRMDTLREQGKDRPLHWEAWKDAHDALGQIPYVKGSLFLDRLRTELGEENFWRGIALYTSRNAHKLVDSKDFEAAMEAASGRDLKLLFDEAVYH